MSEFDKVLYVWCGRPEDTPGDTTVLTGGLMGMTCTPYALGCDVVHWSKLESLNLEKYTLALVVMFGTGERPISTLKRLRPQIVTLALPDPPPEHLFYPPFWGERHRILLDELKQSDYVGDRYLAQGAFIWTKALTGKPVITYPGPLAPTSWWEEMQATATKGGYIAAVAHVGWEPRYNAPTMFILKAVQDATGYPIRMARDDQVSRDLAKTLDLNIEYLGNLSHADFADFLAQAWVLIDLYPMHSMHRASLLAAYLGTPTITSTTSETIPGHIEFDHWRALQYIDHAIQRLQDNETYASMAGRGQTYVEESYSIDALHERTRDLLDLPLCKFGDMLLHDIAALNTAAALDAFWDSDFVRSGQYFEGRDAFYREVADAIASLPNAADNTILDVGCGVGPLLEALDQYHPGLFPESNLSGVDYAQSAIDQVQAAFPQGKFVCGDLLHIQFGALSMASVVTCLEVLEHQDNPEEFVSVLLWLVKPGGTLIITVPDGMHDTCKAHKQFYTIESLTAFLNDLLDTECFQVHRMECGNLMAIIERS